MIKNKKLVFSIAIVIALGGFLFWRYWATRQVVIDIPMAQSYQEVVMQNESQSEPVKPINIVKPDKPKGSVNQNTNVTTATTDISINLAVPFLVQAPLGQWVQPWEDACEEASIMMIDFYFKNQSLPSADKNQIILANMVQWQFDNWGGHYDLGVDDMEQFVEENYDYKTEIIEDLTADKIIDYLQQGLPVIVPADGRLLDNPYFSGEGPDYHVLVIKGFKDGHFIANDPGTKRGGDFVYSKENLMYSITDWDIKKSSHTGLKRALVILPS